MKGRPRTAAGSGGEGADVMKESPMFEISLTRTPAGLALAAELFPQGATQATVCGMPVLLCGIEEHLRAPSDVFPVRDGQERFLEFQPEYKTVWEMEHGNSLHEERLSEAVIDLKSLPSCGVGDSFDDHALAECGVFEVPAESCALVCPNLHRLPFLVLVSPAVPLRPSQAVEDTLISRVCPANSSGDSPTVFASQALEEVSPASTEDIESDDRAVPYSVESGL